MAMEGAEHYLYLTSLGSTDLYPHNEPHRFENRITPAIHLNPNLDYEVGLINCFHPKKYLALVAGEYASRIEVWAIAHVDESRLYKLYTYTPRTSTEVGDTGYMVEIINAELSEELKGNLKGQYDRYFTSNQIFNYNERTRRVERVFRRGQCSNDGHFCRLAVKFGSRMAQVLGFDYNDMYDLYSSYVEGESGVIPAPFPPRTDGGLDYALFYTDCVTPTIYGGQQVNLLEVFTIAGGNDFHPIAYKKLSKSIIDSMAIQLTDQVGRPIHFGSGKSVTVLLHIRQKINK